MIRARQSPCEPQKSKEWAECPRGLISSQRALAGDLGALRHLFSLHREESLPFPALTFFRADQLQFEGRWPLGCGHDRQAICLNPFSDTWRELRLRRGELAAFPMPILVGRLWRHTVRSAGPAPSSLSFSLFPVQSLKKEDAPEAPFRSVIRIHKELRLPTPSANR